MFVQGRNHGEPVWPLGRDAQCDATTTECDPQTANVGVDVRGHAQCLRASDFRWTVVGEEDLGIRTVEDVLDVLEGSAVRLHVADVGGIEDVVEELADASVCEFSGDGVGAVGQYRDGQAELTQISGQRQHVGVDRGC